MARRPSRIVDRLVYLAVRTVIAIFQALSLETCGNLARLFAVLAHDVLRVRRRVVDENLSMVFPDLTDAERDRMARGMWEHLLLMVCEIAQAPRKLHQANFGRHIRFQDKPTLVRYLLEPRATILVTGHFGNFELAGFTAGLLGFPTFTIARNLDNPYLHDFVARFRQSKGQYLLDKDGCAPQVARILEHHGTLGLLGDQHAGQRGITVDFLGRPASCHKAVALFTLTSGAPQLVTYLRRIGKPLEFELGVAGIADPKLGGPELQHVRALTEWYNQRLAEVIRETPDQYWWVHRRWKEAPPRKKKPQRQAA